MNVAFARRGDALIIRPEGEIDHHSCSLIREKSDREFIQKRLLNIEIDLSRVDFIDSSAIGFIMGRYKLAKSLGGGLSVTGVKGNCSRLIRLSGIESFINIKYTDIGGGK